jgi:hypothetical protein
MKYKLPCTCGRTIPVEVTQAGQKVHCSCGASVEVPAMRLIRNLPVADPASPVRTSRGSSWPLLASLLFAVGMLLFVGGLGVAGYYQLGRANLSTDEFKWDGLEEAHTHIDKFSIEESLSFWKLISTNPIGPYDPPYFVWHRLYSDIWLRNVLGSLVVAAVGIVLVAVAFLVRSAKRRTRRPTRRDSTTPADRRAPQ